MGHSDHFFVQAGNNGVVENCAVLLMDHPELVLILTSVEVAVSRVGVFLMMQQSLRESLSLR